MFDPLPVRTVWTCLGVNTLRHHDRSGELNQNQDQVFWTDPVLVLLGVLWYLQGAVQEAAVLTRFVAQPFAGSDGRHAARRHHPRRRSARRRVVPLPRHSGCGLTSCRSDPAIHLLLNRGPKLQQNRWERGTRTDPTKSSKQRLELLLLCFRQNQTRTLEPNAQQAVPTGSDLIVMSQRSEVSGGRSDRGEPAGEEQKVLSFQRNQASLDPSGSEPQNHDPWTSFWDSVPDRPDQNLFIIAT